MKKYGFKKVFGTPFIAFKQRGMSVVEVMIVMVIIAIISLVAAQKLPEILAKNRANKVVDALNVAIPEIQGAYHNSQSFQGLTTAVVADNSWIDKSLIDRAASTINAPWTNGSINFTAINSNRNGQVELTAVPPLECAQIANRGISSDIYLSATINGVSVKANTANSQVNFGATGTQCTAGNTSVITLVFLKG